ncbi:MAG: WYL domain-containing protein [Schleiferiaceae bacterium]|nr:WYL domain-containing protein [Schleiferiaceae bacterium]
MSVSSLRTTRNVLQLIARLRQPLGVDKKQVAADYEVHPKTIDRYLDLLEEIGFEVECGSAGRLHLAEGPRPFRTEDGVTFSLEEAAILRDALINHTADDPRRRGILDKLFTITDMESLGKTISEQRQNQHIHFLKRARQNGFQALLNGYASAHSGTESTRRVEPIRFYHYYRYLVAYEVESGMTKHYKMDRVRSVTLLNKKMQFQAQHAHSPTDVFGMSGAEAIPLELGLSLRAKNLLCEEFPDAQAHIEAREEGYAFVGTVYALEGVGRFVGGLLNEISLPPESPLRPYLVSVYKVR